MNLKVFIFLFFTTFELCGQNFGSTYWQMRQRLLNDFIRVGDCHGCSIPASSIEHRADILYNGEPLQDIMNFLD